MIGYSKVLLFFLFCFFAHNVKSQVINANWLYIGDPVLFQGTTNNPVMRVEIEIGTNPGVLTNFLFDPGTSTSVLGDIANMKLWYSNNSVFDIASAMLLGIWSPFGPTTNFEFLATNPGYTGIAYFSNMVPGNNYFWLTYDIKPGATSCDTVDANCASFVFGGVSYTPTGINPGNFSIITLCTTGMIAQADIEFDIYPNPAKETITISAEDAINEQIDISLFDVRGKAIPVEISVLTFGSIKKFTLNLTGLTPGFYIVKTKRKTFTGNHKVIRL